MSQTTEGASTNPPESTNLPETIVITTINPEINPEINSEINPEVNPEINPEIEASNTNPENALLGEIHEDSDDETEEVLESSSQGDFESSDYEDEDLEEFTDGSDFDDEELDLSYSSEDGHIEDSQHGTLDETDGTIAVPSQVTEMPVSNDLLNPQYQLHGAQSPHGAQNQPQTQISRTTTTPQQQQQQPQPPLVELNSIPSIAERMCWICLSPNEFSELDDTDKLDLKNYSSWIHPCKCKGTQAWVHQACLRRWIDMKQEGDLMKKVKCSQCKHVYHFSRPPVSKVIKYGRRMVDISQTVSMLSSAATAASGALYIALKSVKNVKFGHF